MEAQTFLIGYIAVKPNYQSFNNTSLYLKPKTPYKGTVDFYLSIKDARSVTAVSHVHFQDHLILKVRVPFKDVFYSQSIISPIGHRIEQLLSHYLYVEEVIANSYLHEKSWDEALKKIRTIDTLLFKVNQKATSPKITSIISQFKKLHYHSKCSPYIINNIFEVDKALSYLGGYEGTDAFASNKSWEEAKKIVDQYKWPSSVPIDIFNFKETTIRILAAYLAAHQTNNQDTEKDVILSYIELLELGCFPIGFGSKNKFPLYKPSIDLSAMSFYF